MARDRSALHSAFRAYLRDDKPAAPNSCAANGEAGNGAVTAGGARAAGHGETNGVGCIPAFYTLAESARHGALGQEWVRMASDVFVSDRSEYTWSKDASDRLERAFRHYAVDAEKSEIDYAGYCKAREHMEQYMMSGHEASPESVKEERRQGMRDSVRFGAPTLEPEYFFMFRHLMSSTGSIPVAEIFTFLKQKAMLFQMQIELSWYSAGKGYLTADDLEQFLRTLVTESLLDSLSFEGWPADQHEHYVCALVRIFFFYLDDHQRKRVSMAKILSSPLLWSLVKIQLAPEQAGEDTWISVRYQRTLYQQFVHLAADKDYLTPANLTCLGYPAPQFSSLFCERVFNAFNTERLQYQDYLDFMLTVRDFGCPSALPFLLRVASDDTDSGLTECMMRRLYASCQTDLSSGFGDCGSSPTQEDEAVTQLFDLVQPKSPRVITLSDLRRITPDLRREFFRLLFLLECAEDTDALPDAFGLPDNSHGVLPFPG